MSRLFVLFAGSALTLLAIGCGPSEPEQANIAPQDREQMVREDAERIMQERGGQMPSQGVKR